MPTETDVKIAAALADFRVEVSERFGRVDAQFAAIEAELRVIRKLGTWLLGGVFGLVATLITGAAAVGWSAASVEGRIDRVERRLDGIDRKLDTIIGRVGRGEKSAPGS